MLGFRARPDASHYDLFYLRPGNSTSDDQSMRNHSVQYSCEPDFGWYTLRRRWPWVYEAWADLKTETWTKSRYLSGSAVPRPRGAGRTACTGARDGGGAGGQRLNASKP